MKNEGNVVPIHDEEKELGMEDILSSNDETIRPVKVPEWGGTIYLGSLSAEDIIEWSEISDADKEKKRVAGIRLLVKSLVNKSGKRIGKDTDIPKLAHKSHAVCERLLAEVLDLNGMRTKDQRDASKNV